MDSCHHHTLGPPVDIRVRKCIQKWIVSQAILNYTDFVNLWDPVQIEASRQLQEYAETDESIACLSEPHIQTTYQHLELHDSPHQKGKAC